MSLGALVGGFEHISNGGSAIDLPTYDPRTDTDNSQDKSIGESLGNIAGNFVEKSEANDLFTTQGEQNRLNREFNSAEAKAQREWQHDEAQIEREWYEAMSNSAYSRAMADMRRSGLNPILAYSQGGAVTSGTGLPSGSAAGYTATGGDSVGSLLTSAASIIGAVSMLRSGNLSKVIKALKKV